MGDNPTGQIAWAVVVGMIGGQLWWTIAPVGQFLGEQCWWAVVVDISAHLVGIWWAC